MDSITQIILGAAVGEAVAGRKIGNRALLWGGIGGTIPDLDIIASPFLSEIESVAFHRGFSHSFVCCILLAPLMAWLISWIGKKRKSNEVSFYTWTLLFFLAFVTHVLLDACTMYGTQLFSPFSDVRISFNIISVADPLYSVPFGLCVLATSFMKRTSSKRRWINYMGLAWGCLYLLFSSFNKSRVDHIFESTLKKESITYSRSMSGPTILNNVLWYGCAESDDEYIYGLYSFFDTEKSFKLYTIPKNHDLLQAKSDDRTLQTIDWFTNGYYNVMTRRDGRIQINDLRYGTFRLESQSEDDFVFRFPLDKDNNGYYILTEAGQGPPKERRNSETFTGLWNRIKGV